MKKMPGNVVVLLRDETGRRLVRDRCRHAGLDMDILEELIELELEQAGRLRRRGLYDGFDEIFGRSGDEEEN